MHSPFHSPSKHHQLDQTKLFPSQIQASIWTKMGLLQGQLQLHSHHLLQRGNKYFITIVSPFSSFLSFFSPLAVWGLIKCWAYDSSTILHVGIFTDVHSGKTAHKKMQDTTLLQSLQVAFLSVLSTWSNREKWCSWRGGNENCRTLDMLWYTYSVLCLKTK